MDQRHKLTNGNNKPHGAINTSMGCITVAKTAKKESQKAKNSSHYLYTTYYGCGCKSCPSSGHFTVWSRAVTNMELQGPLMEKSSSRGGIVGN